MKDYDTIYRNRLIAIAIRNAAWHVCAHAVKKGAGHFVALYLEEGNRNFKPPFCISRTVSACAKVVKFDVMHVNTRLALALQVARSRQFHDNLMI